MTERLIKPSSVIRNPNERQWTISKSLDGGVRISLEGVATIDLSPQSAIELAAGMLEICGFKLEKSTRPGFHLDA